MFFCNGSDKIPLVYYDFYIPLDDVLFLFMMIFIRMHERKKNPRILFPNGMGWRELLNVGVQYKQWNPRIVFSRIDFKFLGKQEVWEMDSPLNKVILIRVVQ